MNSRLYHGKTWHARTQPAYRFEYGVFYFYLDLEEIEAVDRNIRLFSYNRLNLLSLLDRDHMGAPGMGVRDSVYAHLRAGGFDPVPGRVFLLTTVRLLNYVFNPVSFYFCRDADGRLARVLAEVHNTWGQRHMYDLERRPTGEDHSVYVAAAGKAFYVSPFIDMEAQYEFRFQEGEDGRIGVRIDASRQARPFFEAGLDVRPLPLTDANVMKMLLRYPLVTFKTIAAIHWQGLKLWLRGERFRSNPNKPERRPRPVAASPSPTVPLPSKGEGRVR